MRRPTLRCACMVLLPKPKAETPARLCVDLTPLKKKKQVHCGRLSVFSAVGAVLPKLVASYTRLIKDLMSVFSQLPVECWLNTHLQLRGVSADASYGHGGAMTQSLHLQRSVRGREKLHTSGEGGSNGYTGV